MTRTPPPSNLPSLPAVTCYGVTSSVRFGVCTTQTVRLGYSLDFYGLLSPHPHPPPPEPSSAFILPIKSSRIFGKKIFRVALVSSCVINVFRSSRNRPGQAQRVPGWLRPWIFLTFDTTRVVGRQPYASAAFTPEEIPGTHFQRLSRPQGTWFRRSHGKIPSYTTGNRSRDRPTSSIVP